MMRGIPKTRGIKQDLYGCHVDACVDGRLGALLLSGTLHELTRSRGQSVGRGQSESLEGIFLPCRYTKRPRVLLFGQGLYFGQIAISPRGLIATLQPYIHSNCMLEPSMALESVLYASIIFFKLATSTHTSRPKVSCKVCVCSVERG